MQLVEATYLGLRSARLSLRKPQSPVEITLFPMVHLGEPAFFKTVYDDAFSHDVVLVEGVNSPVGRHIARAYSWAVGSRAMAGLIVQPRYPSQSSCDARIVHADMTAEAFSAAWLRVPLWLRVVVYVAAPVTGLHLRWFGSRTRLAKRLAMDDQPSQQELLTFSPEAAFLDQAMLDSRDDSLLSRLAETLDEARSSQRRIAVVYGAAHMRAVLRALVHDHGYSTEHGEWLTVWQDEGHR